MAACYSLKIQLLGSGVVNGFPVILRNCFLTRMFFLPIASLHCAPLIICSICRRNGNKRRNARNPMGHMKCTTCLDLTRAKR